MKHYQVVVTEKVTTVYNVAAESEEEARKVVYKPARQSVDSMDRSHVSIIVVPKEYGRNDYSRILQPIR